MSATILGGDSDHLAWGREGRKGSWRMEDLVVSQAETWGEYSRPKEQQKCPHLTVEGTVT